MKSRITSAIGVFLFSLGSAMCQVNTASLTGLIRDSSDAVVPDAKVSARNNATGIERISQTNSTGYYVLANLPIGTLRNFRGKDRLSESRQHARTWTQRRRGGRISR